MILATATTWPEALIASCGILFVTAVIVTIAIQIFKTGRTGIEQSGNEEYRKLAERVAEQLQANTETLAALEQRVGEIERVLKDV